MRPLVRQSFRPVTAGIVFCVVYLAVLVISVIFSAAIPKPTSQWCYAFIAPILYIVAVIAGGLMDGTDVVAALGVKRAPRPREAGLTVALAVACVVAFLPLAAGVQWLFGRMGYHDTPSYADYSSTWGNMLLGLVGLALMPALGEEILCRGMMFGALKQNGTVYGIFLSALLFALWHGSPVQLVHQFLIGVVMALLVHFTRTVWTSIIFHFCNNAIVIIYEFVYKQAGWTYTIEWWVYLIMFVVGLPLVLALLYVFVRGVIKRAERGVLVLAKAPETPQEHVRHALDVNGEYVPYIGGWQSMIAVYAALGLVTLLWLANTISGWVAS